MANLIYNSSGNTFPFGGATEGYNFLTISGSTSPITNAIQPKVKGGAAMNLGCTGTTQSAGAVKLTDGAGTISSALNGVMLGGRFGYFVGSRPYRGDDNGVTFALGTQYAITGIPMSGANIAFSGSPTNMLALLTYCSGLAGGTASGFTTSGVVNGLNLPMYIGAPTVTSGVGIAYQSGANAGYYGSSNIISAIWSGTNSGTFIASPAVGVSGTYNTSGVALLMNVPQSSTTWAVTGPVNYQGSWNAQSPGLAGMTNALTSRAFIAQRLSNMTIAGIGGTAGTLLTGGNVLLSGGNAGILTRSINKREQVRTTKITTALRAGYYNRFLGKWTTAPSIQADAVNIGLHTDTAAMVNPNLVTVSGQSGAFIFVGLLTYKWGWPGVTSVAGGGVVTQAYKPKTGTTSSIYVTGWNNTLS